MSISFTPGPWTVDALGLGTIGSVETMDGTCIAQCMQMLPLDTDRTDEHRKANAHLISAAPAMLEALKRIAKLGGNLPDARLTDKTGANDAAARGLMYTEARRLAKEALALAIPAPGKNGGLRRAAYDPDCPVIEESKG